MSQAIVVMGVTASGKSTLGEALAHALGCPFVEGDLLHPPANIAKMAAGGALTDEDRVPFLESVARSIATRQGDLVISCSALKRAYRDRLRRADPQLLFVLPLLSRAALEQRLRQRSGHFMPATLLDSQLRDLEPPQPDEGVIQIDGTRSPEQQVADTLGMMRASRN
jgi:carbohydrate kinase (thermoresistant glucokinase family)